MAYTFLGNLKQVAKKDNTFGASIVITMPDEEKEIIKDTYAKLYFLKKKKLIEVTNCMLLKPGEYYTDDEKYANFNIFRVEGIITQKGINFNSNE